VGGEPHASAALRMAEETFSMKLVGSEITSGLLKGKTSLAAFGIRTPLLRYSFPNLVGVRSMESRLVKTNVFVHE
jgi:hypothetical protein